MKRKLVFLALIILLFTATAIAIKSYERSRADEYAILIENMLEQEPAGSGIEQEVKVKKIIRATPSELMISVNWAKNEEAYVYIKNWLTKEHDIIKIYTLHMGMQE